MQRDTSISSFGLQSQAVLPNSARALKHLLIKHEKADSLDLETLVNVQNLKEITADEAFKFHEHWEEKQNYNKLIDRIL